MNKELFEDILSGQIDSDNYSKSKISKSKFYKVYKRVRFYSKVVEPIKFLVLNSSEKEFQATQDSKLKTELKSRKSGKGFPMGSVKPRNEADDLNE